MLRAFFLKSSACSDSEGSCVSSMALVAGASGVGLTAEGVVSSRAWLVVGSGVLLTGAESVLVARTTLSSRTLAIIK